MLPSHKTPHTANLMIMMLGRTLLWVCDEADINPWGTTYVVDMARLKGMDISGTCMSFIASKNCVNIVFTAPYNMGGIQSGNADRMTSWMLQHLQLYTLSRPSEMTQPPDWYLYRIRLYKWWYSVMGRVNILRPLGYSEIRTYPTDQQTTKKSVII